jgi:hypothetical protein
VTDTTELAVTRKHNATAGLGLWEQLDITRQPTTHPEPVTGTSQNAAILRYLQAGYALTPREALTMFGTMRLAARVADLRAKGHTINSERYETDSGKFVSRYTLEARQ